MTSDYDILISMLQHGRVAMIEHGRELKKIKEGELWKTEIGDGINTWFDFLKQPEIGLTVAEAEFLIGLSEMADKYGAEIVARIPLATARFMLKHGGDIDDAQFLSTRDFKEKYYEVAHPMQDQTYTYLIMKRSNETGNLTRVYGETIEEGLNELINKEVHNR